MTDVIMAWLAGVRHTFEIIPGDVLEVGSYDENGSARYIFECGASSYLGIDLRDGPGVDTVGDIRQLVDLPQFDTVICTEVIEHDSDPIRLVQRMRELLKTEGHLILTSPTNEFPEHRYPRDYWRIMPDAYTDILLKGLRILDYQVLGPRYCQSNCWLCSNELVPPSREQAELI